MLLADTVLIYRILKLLNFFKSSFYFFTACSVLAAVALVPINYRENGTTEGLPPPSSDPDDEKYKNLYLQMLGKKHQSDPAYHGTTLYLTSRSYNCLQEDRIAVFS